MDGVKRAEGGFSADFLCQGEDREIAVHVMSMLPSMNKVAVTKGRLPEKPGECLADDEMHYKVGDTVVLKSGDGTKVTDTLTTDTLTVVGTGNSPCYISFNRGNTTIGTGSLTGFFVVPASTFDMDVYTEAYVQAEGAKKLTAYTDAYENRIKKIQDNIKAITGERGSIRRQELTDEAEEELGRAEKELADGRKEADLELLKAEQELTDCDVKEAAVVQMQEQIKDLEDTAARLQQEMDALDITDPKYAEKYNSLESQKNQAEADRNDLRDNKLPDAQKDLQESRTLYGQSQKAYDAARKDADSKLAVYEQKLDSGAAQLNDTKTKFSGSEATLSSAWSQIQDGQAQIDSGWAQIEKQEAALADAESEIAASAAELADGWKEYEAAKEKAEQKLADGEQKIADAKDEIGKIKDPKWYVYDRNTLAEYAGYGDNADRMRAIGKVFPVLFFLVAALISLTSMTRMVEEQRTEIGTMKALGYNKLTIASKYLGYALLATLGGSIFGVLLGEKVLPYIIIYAYGIMYHHIPDILTPYNLTYAAAATLAALACTMGATLAACYKELSAEPAVLMRPPAPKNGKRVFLERVLYLEETEFYVEVHRAQSHAL